MPHRLGQGDNVASVPATAVLSAAQATHQVGKWPSRGAIAARSPRRQMPMSERWPGVSATPLRPPCVHKRASQTQSGRLDRLRWHEVTPYLQVLPEACSLTDATVEAWCLRPSQLDRCVTSVQYFRMRSGNNEAEDAVCCYQAPPRVSIKSANLLPARADLA